MSSFRQNIRRCHCCGHVTVRSESVIKCEKCTKSFAPFFYFHEDDVKVPTESKLRPKYNADAYPPIQGLTARWETS